MESELRKLNFDVINIAYPDHVFRYKNSFQRLQNLIRKLFLNDKHFKNRLKFKPFEKAIRGKLDDIVLADYALIIRPDIYPREILKLIKMKSKIMVGYQWDGLERFKGVKNYIPLFDRFYAFDIVKQKHDSGIVALTNFYFENINIITSQESNSNNVFFVGSYCKARMTIINKCAEILNKKGFSVNFYLFANRNAVELETVSPLIHFVSEAIKYDRYLQYLNDSKVLADFLNPVHNGLSFRIFEAIGYEKKLITTNKAVCNYDFFNPNNIFILENDNWDELEQFMSLNYEPIPERIKRKYSFENWINYVLDINVAQDVPYKQEYGLTYGKA